jgi:Amt family ammonium transporter
VNINAPPSTTSPTVAPLPEDTRVPTVSSSTAADTIPSASTGPPTPSPKVNPTEASPETNPSAPAPPFQSRFSGQDIDLLQYCIGSGIDPSNGTALLTCAIHELQHDLGSRAFSQQVLVVYAAALVFLMQAGFAMVCAGAVRKKNVQNTLLKNLLDACGASLAFFATGYAFAFGGMDITSPEKTFVGHTNFFLMNVDDLAFWIYQYAFSAASATIIAGTLAERCQMTAYLCYSLMLVGWVYPIIVHSIWNPQGFLSAHSIDPLWGVGMVDFSGSGVVHMTGGITALYATMILGPRCGRFHDEAGRIRDRPKVFPAYSKALQMLGTFILWFGWYGFNAGSALLGTHRDTGGVAALAATNTTLSGGSAGVISLFLHLWWLERTTGEPFFDITYAMNGALAGLVAVTGGCGVFEPWAAVITGAVAGVLYNIGTKLLMKLRLDDAVEAIPVHLFAGVWGVISVGLFASPNRLFDVYGRNEHPGLFYSWYQGRSDGTLLGAQLVGILFIAGWVGAIMFPFFVWLDWKGWFRADPLDEIVGLDTSYHGNLTALRHGENDEDINPEYIAAYRQKRDAKLRRRAANASHTRAAVQFAVPSDPVNQNDAEGDRDA